jgi:hypothetical protein
VDNPDETVQVFPETCADCGAGLADGADAGVSSRQVFDVPPVTVRVTEYMLSKKQCRCGCLTAATPPAGVADAPVSYGPNLPQASQRLTTRYNDAQQQASLRPPTPHPPPPTTQEVIAAGRAGEAENPMPEQVKRP